MFGDPKAKTTGFGMELDAVGGSGRHDHQQVVPSAWPSSIQGSYSTSDFEDRITAFYDFTGGGVRKVAPSDAYGHGTHVAGLIGSRFVGVAPNVRLIGLKVLDAKGQGRTSDVLRAIQFAIDNKDALGIRVLNLSLGHPVYEPAATDPLVQAVESAVRAGLVVVDVGRELRREPGDAPAGLRGRDLAGQRPVGADGRRGSDVRHAFARRQSHRALQLTRALVVRRVREARRRGARTRAALDCRSGQRCCAGRTRRAAVPAGTCG